MIEQGFTKDAIQPKFGTLSTEYEQDSYFNAEMMIEKAHMQLLEMYSNLTEYWRTIMNGKTEIEELYTSAEVLLYRYLYESGFTLKKRKGEPNHLYLCNNAALLLHRVKLQLGVLQSLRGDLDSAKERFTQGLQIAEQCYAATTSRAIAELHYYLGRANRLSINTPVSVETIWGSKQLTTKKIANEMLEHPKSDLSFLKPIGSLESSLNHSYTKSFHDHTLMRSSIMELVYLYGSKLVKDSEDVEGSTMVVHSAIATCFMLQSARITQMLHRKLYRGVEAISGETPAVKNKPPQFACEEMETMAKEHHILQTQFSGIDLVPDEIALSSRNILVYYTELLSRYQTCTPALASYLDARLVEMHRYMMTEYPPYSSECIVTTLPTTQNVYSAQLISGSFVCIQFHTVDNGLTPFVKTRAVTAREEFLAKQRKGEANLPLISMFYSVNAGTDTSVRSSSAGGGKKDPKTVAPDVTLPDVGMMSFEQDTLRKIHQKLVNLLHTMTKNNCVSLKGGAEERPPSAKTTKATDKKKAPVTNKPPPTASSTKVEPISDTITLQVQAERDQTIIELIGAIQDAVSPAMPQEGRSSVEECKEMADLIQTKAQVETLVDLFDFSAGGSLYRTDLPQDELITFVHKLFHKYHEE
jgi:hypothetical protein